jgi:hypothetical protein
MVAAIWSIREDGYLGVLGSVVGIDVDPLQATLADWIVLLNDGQEPSAPS